MVSEGEYFNTLTEDELWKRYCGFLDLSLQEFMLIQEHLLLEQLEEIGDTVIGKQIMGDTKPATVADFRRLVPLTTYDDYAPYLNEKREDVLFEKPYIWLRTSGRSGTPKWIPYTERAYKASIRNIVGAIILACTMKKGEVNIKQGERLVCNLPPPPYGSGIYITSLQEALNLRVIPPLDLAAQMDCQERIEKGFAIALKTGVDIVGSLSSVMMKMGETFTNRATGMKFSTAMINPPVLYRIIRAVVRSKLERRGMLPKDLWPAKGILAMGTDTTLYKDKITYYWGKEPYELYVATEAGVVALQSWTKKAMTFLPFFSFFEFIPEKELIKNREDKSYQPSTVLLDEVKEGERYELVATTFHGIPFLRNRIGDLIQIVALKDEDAGIQTPQMIFSARADDIIDIAGFARFDEKMIWQVLNNTGIQYQDWTVRKEYIGDNPILHLYIELKQEMNIDKLRSLLHSSLVVVNSEYEDLENMLEIDPLNITLLSKGTFERYYMEKQAEGVDLAYLKPPHMNPRDAMVETLLKLSKVT